MRVAVCFGQVPEGARQDEQDVLVEVETVRKALLELGHEAFALPLSLDLAAGGKALGELRPDMVFNLVESLDSQGCFIYFATALFDSMRIPYTGSGTDAVFLTSNKVLAKAFMGLQGIPTPPWFTLEALGPTTAVPGRRYIVKSVWEHASVGLTADSVARLEGVGELGAAMEERARRAGGEVFAEAYIDGREFNLALLAGDGRAEVLPPAEIAFDSYPPDKLRIVDYSAKWEEGSFEYTHTTRRQVFPPSDSKLLEKLEGLAKNCWDSFGLKGYARVDFRVDAGGEPWVLEVNVNPCISPDAGFFAAAARAGLSMADVVQRILQGGARPCWSESHRPPGGSREVRLT